MSALETLREIATRFSQPFAASRKPLSYDVLRLGWFLDIPPRALLQFQSARRESRYHYRPMQHPKRDGTARQLYVPSADLKALQRALLRNYLDSLPVHNAATGFRRGLSVADNARRHVGRSIVVTADIADFFDHTTAERVREFFNSQGWDTTASRILTGLCTFRGVLPQGAPTSPVLSNLVNIPLDEALTALARRSDAVHTRYGDDMAFSWARPPVPFTMRRAVLRVLLRFGYRLNVSKGWHVWRVRRGDRPCIAGVYLGRDGHLHPSPEILREMRRLRKRRDAASLARLRGYEGFVNMLKAES